MGADPAGQPGHLDLLAKLEPPETRFERQEVDGHAAQVLGQQGPLVLVHAQVHLDFRVAGQQRQHVAQIGHPAARLGMQPVDQDPDRPRRTRLGNGRPRDPFGQDLCGIEEGAAPPVKDDAAGLDPGGDQLGARAIGDGDDPVRVTQAHGLRPRAQASE